MLASMIDNMPYVLAEASVMRIPLLIYDVGGVTEMIDPKQHARHHLRHAQGGRSLLFLAPSKDMGSRVQQHDQVVCIT